MFFFNLNKSIFTTIKCGKSDTTALNAVLNKFLKHSGYLFIYILTNKLIKKSILFTTIHRQSLFFKRKLKIHHKLNPPTFKNSIGTSWNSSILFINTVDVAIRLTLGPKQSKSYNRMNIIKEVQKNTKYYYGFYFITYLAFSLNYFNSSIHKYYFIIE